jgi:hypothetical protein
MPGPSNSITSANALLFLGVANLFSTPQQIQQFSADDIYDMPSIRSSEVSMGIDGTLSGGFVYVPIAQSIMLQANSPSNSLFEQWWLAQQVAEDVYIANGSVTLNSLGEKWTMTRGFLTGYTPAPRAAKILQPRRYEITWNKVLPQPSNTAAA